MSHSDFMTPRNQVAWLSGLLTLFLLGCGEPEPSAYEVPREESASTPPPAASSDAPFAQGNAPQQEMTVLPGMAVQAAQFGSVSGTAPATWTEQPAAGVRRGTYTIANNAGSAELTITAFPGDVGGLVANINRWRGQVGLAPVNASGLNRTTRPVAGFPSDIVLLEGAEQAILGAIVDRGDHTWFFKMTGDPAAVRAEQNHFDAYLDTVEFSN